MSCCFFELSIVSLRTFPIPHPWLELSQCYAPLVEPKVFLFSTWKHLHTLYAKSAKARSIPWCVTGLSELICSLYEFHRKWFSSRESDRMTLGLFAFMVYWVFNTQVLLSIEILQVCSLLEIKKNFSWRIKPYQYSLSVEWRAILKE